jgi:hypothetical protein
MFAAHKLLNNSNKYGMIIACLQHINHENVQMSNHGMFAAHKLLKHKYEMIMACLQHINHKYAL